MGKIKKLKTVPSYETTDGTVFTNENAEEKAEKYQKLLNLLKKSPETVEEVIKIFKKEIIDKSLEDWKFITKTNKGATDEDGEKMDEISLNEEAEDVDQYFWENLSENLSKVTVDNGIQICSFEDYVRTLMFLMNYAHLEEVIHTIKRFM